MPSDSKGSIPGLAFAGIICLLFSALFPHPNFEDLRFTRGQLAEIQSPNNDRYSFLLEIASDSEHSLTLAITTNNNQASWDLISAKVGQIERSRPIEVWFLDIWFLNFPPEIWHLEQDGNVILNFDSKDYEYGIARNLFGAVGSVLILISMLLFYRRSRASSVSHE